MKRRRHPPATSGAEGGNSPLKPGQVIDGFRLEEALHRGGMATLWRVSRVQADGSRPTAPTPCR
jgi:hypothetical protein